MVVNSLRGRLLVSLLAVFMLGFAALAFYLHDARDDLRRRIAFIQAQEIGAGLNAGSDFGRLPARHAGGELSYTLYSANGEVLWYSDNLERPRRLRLSVPDDRPSLFRLTSGANGRVVNVPVRLSDGSVLMVAKEDRAERESIDSLFQVRMVGGLLVLLPFCLLAAGLVFVLMHWTLRPVRRAVELARGIGPHEPDRRIPLDELPREVLPLAQTANDGLQRLAQAYEYEQRIVADAAHELRTPLTVLDLRLQKCRLEGKADWPAIEREMGQLQKLVSQLLALARQDQTRAGQRYGLPHANLSRIVREVVAGMLPLFEARGRALEVDLQDGVAVAGDAGLLHDAVRNAVENALFHGEGLVEIRLAGLGEGGALLDVVDRGKGVPLQDQERMFDRFRKGRQGSAGAGLGLAIVRGAMRDAGGDAAFVSTGPCVFRMRFAVADPPAPHGERR